MKRISRATALTVLTLLCAGLVVAQQMEGGRGKTELALSGGTVVVEYGRPALAGRDITQMMNEQLPVGSPWRMGMNTATTLTTDVPLKFGSTVVSAGKYALQAKRVDEKNWVMIFNQEGSKPVEVPIQFKKASSSAETLTINLSKKGNGGDFLLHWGTFTLSTNFAKA